MRHPDKINGQQTYELRLIPVILQTLLLGSFIGLACLLKPAPATATVLKDVRMGNHNEFIRIVFELSAPVQYELSENSGTETASIRFLDSTSELKGKPISETLDCIDTVSARQDGGHIVADISFETKNVKLNPFMIKEPDRMVLDVFCETESTATMVLPEPREISPPPDTVVENTQKKTIVNPPLVFEQKPVVKETPDPVVEQKPVVKETPDPVVEQKQVVKETPGPKDNSQQFLLLLLAGISSIIILLIALIIFQKRNLSTSQMSEDADATMDTDKMMYAIDRKIKEKLMNDDK